MNSALQGRQIPGDLRLEGQQFDLFGVRLWPAASMTTQWPTHRVRHTRTERSMHAGMACDPPRALIQIDPLDRLAYLVGTVTEGMFLLLPSFAGALGDVLHLSATRTGLLASADLTGIALTTATAPWWLRRVSWRRTVLASLLAFLPINFPCFAVRSFWRLRCLRVLAGLNAGAAEGTPTAQGIVRQLAKSRGARWRVAAPW